MPRVRKGAKEEKPKDNPPEVKRYLEDGHPNPVAMNLWDFMQELTEDQWSEYIGYLYRVEPRKMPTERKRYIAVVVSPLTQEDVKRLYGGQKFTLIFNRRVGKRQVAIYTERFDIEAVEIPQDGEVFEKDSPSGRQRSATLGSGTDPTVLEGLTNLISNLVAQNAEAQRTGQPFNSVAAMVEGLKIQSLGATAAIDMMKKEKGGSKEDSGVKDKILDKLLDRAFAPPPQTDPIGQIKAVLELTNELRPAGGGGSSGPESPWLALATVVGPKLDTILEKIEGIFQNRAVIAMSANPAALAQIQKPAAPATAGTPTGAAPAAAPSAGTQPTPEQVQKYNRSVIIDQIKKAIVQMLFDGSPGDLAAEVAEKMDPEFAAEFAKVLEKDIASLTKDPILAPAVTAPRLSEFVAEFLGYFAQEAPAETEAVPAASPAA